MTGCEFPHKNMSDSSAPNDPGPTGPVFNPARLKILLGLEEEGDDMMIRDIAQQFITDINTVINRIGKAITDGDYTRIAADAHTVKGSSAPFGLSLTEQIAKQLEATVKGGDQTRIPALYASLGAAFAAGCEALNAYLVEK